LIEKSFISVKEGKPRLPPIQGNNSLSLKKATHVEISFTSVMTFELQKTLRQPSGLAAAQYLAHRHPRVVIGNPLGCPAEKLERLRMPLPKGLGALALKGHFARFQLPHHSRFKRLTAPYFRPSDTVLVSHL
jgi:hypothetical protein